ncbi:MAG: hypothetical protein CSA66_01370 [Proteobacteria bacterium]|nr:MAG: hypothetical protein CSA66_01370 [Pseudomonadota bacterium]
MAAARHKRRKTLYLVDGSGYVFRAFYAIRSLTTSEGFATNAIYGFTQMVVRLVEDEQPDYLAVVFDPPGPSFRRALYADYKANRPPKPKDLVPQLPLVRDVLRAFNIPSLEVEGFEADDVIATLATRAKGEDVTTVIVSSDKDLMQLVGDDCVLLDTMKNVRYDAAAVEGKLGVRPDKVLDLLALMGDSSDNIPGVPGIGPKTAAKLLDRFGSLDGLYERVCEVKGKRRARLEEAATLEVPVPDGLAAALRPYQRDGLTWLGRIAHWSTGACLADDMGLGKTVQALGLMLRRGDVGPQLVVAPTSLGFNWRREAARFAPSLTLSSFRGRHHLELLEGTLGPGEVVVTSYDLLARYGEQLGAHRWATVVLDEAQAIKNPATRRARSAFALAAEFVLALTGTPVENRSGEVWSLFRAIAPGLLGSSADFRRAFALPIERDRSAEARQGLAGIIRPFVLRRLKSEVARELPPRTEVEVGVELSGAERHLYEELRAAAASALAGAEGVASNQRRFLALQALTRLRQLACHPRLVDPRSAVASSKLAVLRELVSELRDEGHRVLVFSQFVSLLALVREAFEADGVSYRYLDGSTPEARRREEIDAFQQGGADVFLLSLKAGGTGLNLTAADYVIHLDPWWNPAVEDQATDRAHRIGQDKPVTVLRLISQGTVEEGIMALHADKRALADALLSGAGAGQSLSVEELTALISGAWEHGEREAEQTQAPPGPPADP